MRHNFKKIIFCVVMMTVVLAGCTSKENNKQGVESNKLLLVASFSIIYDILQEVGGDLVEVHSMVPIGTAPHEYEPLPTDIKKATEADALFYNGLNLEGGQEGWFLGKLVPTVHKEESKVYEVMRGVDPMYLSSEDGKEQEMNPHAFLSPIVGMTMVENVMDALVEIDPRNAETYKKNGEEFLQKLHEIDEMYKEKIAKIPPEKRILVTSERAFQYMTSHYGLQEGYIWTIDTEENGTPHQIKNLVQFIQDNNITALFVESNVDKRPMETVANETGAKIVGEVYSDELGRLGSEGETYTGFLTSNIETIYEGLK